MLPTSFPYTCTVCQSSSASLGSTTQGQNSIFETYLYVYNTFPCASPSLYFSSLTQDTFLYSRVSAHALFSLKPKTQESSLPEQQQPKQQAKPFWLWLNSPLQLGPCVYLFDPRWRLADWLGICMGCVCGSRRAQVFGTSQNRSSSSSSNCSLLHQTQKGREFLEGMKKLFSPCSTEPTAPERNWQKLTFTSPPPPTSDTNKCCIS